jgi:hypothetical protein
LWQQYRDVAAWSFQKSESALQRQHEVGIMAMEFANSLQLYDKEQKDNMALAAGTWIANWIADSSANFETTDNETEEEDTVT